MIILADREEWIKDYRSMRLRDERRVPGSPDNTAVDDAFLFRTKADSHKYRW